jgi:NADH pyrophosphatase NudC (nudix superfamily)
MEAKGKEPFKIQISEIRDAKWFTSEEALKAVAYKGSKEILKKVLKRAKSPL